MSNGLVYVGRVVFVEPIEGADRIERVEVVCGKGGRWSSVARVGDFAIGDLCEVYLQDSILPEHDDRFDFMQPHGYRVRMMRLRGVPSEALVMPLSSHIKYGLEKLGVGADITDMMGVMRHEKPLPVTIGGDIAGRFPSFVPKTDEPNFQGVPHLVEALRGQRYYVTEKADGTSTTAFMLDGIMQVCSRNYILKSSETNALWQVARAYEIEEKLLALGGNMAMQWETVGPGIQGNPMGLLAHSMRLFDIYDIDTRRYLDGWWLIKVADALDLPMVPVLHYNDDFNYTDEGLRVLAEGEYENGQQREGIVVRPPFETYVQGERLSFKVINLNYAR